MLRVDLEDDVEVNLRRRDFQNKNGKNKRPESRLSAKRNGLAARACVVPETAISPIVRRDLESSTQI